MSITYNTPKRTHIVKTRLDDKEHADFLHQVEIYGMNQSEFIHEAISGATIRPVIVVSNVNDAMLESIRKLTAEFGRIGSNLNQIARHLNEWHTPYPNITKELQNTSVDLAALKFEVMEKVGDAIGDIQAYVPLEVSARSKWITVPKRGMLRGRQKIDRPNE